MTIKYEPRWYQEKAINDSMNFIQYSRKKYGLMVLPTGAGKSIVIALLAKRLGCKILVLQPNKELLKQNYEKYTSYGLDASVYSASLKSKEIGDVTFATIGSIVSKSVEFKGYGFDYVLIDECHWATKKNAQTHRFVEYIGVKKIIGLTATPVNLTSSQFGGTELKMINRSKSNMFEDIYHVTQIGELAKDNFWSTLVYHPIKMKTDMLVLNSTGTDYTERSLGNYYDDNNLHAYIIRCVERLRELGKKHILVFVPKIIHAKMLCSCIPGAEYVTGDTTDSERDRIIDGFRDGTGTDVVINVNVMGTGFDFPAMDAGIHARPTNSVNVWYQHIGRFVRKHESKKDAMIVDISSNYLKFGPIENFTFENDSYYGWCMYSGDKLLTGVDLAARVGRYRKTNADRVEYDKYIMPFGLHKGKKLDSIPLPYLEFIAYTYSGKTDIVKELKAKCKVALAVRQR